MSDTLKTVVVVGGSLTGLMNALAFRSLGYKVHVLERSPPSALDSQAAGIRVGPEVHDFIKKYIPDYARDYDIMADAVEIVKDNGDVELKIPPKDPLRLTTWKSIYDMFLTCLLKEGSETSATYQTGSSVQDVSLKRGKVHVRYTTMNDGTDAEMEADLVIAADGAHSTIRHQLYPGVSPEYAGYVSWRGRVPESALSSSTREALQDRCVIHRVEGGYQISYYVPAESDSAHPKGRDFVFIWYDTLPIDSPDFRETMTDVEGKTHRTTVPRGKLQPKVWKRLLARKAAIANPFFIELIGKIQEPFVSAISDFQGSRAVFHDGKVLLAGDAFNLCRPHGGGSTSQAAFQVEQLVKCWYGEMTLSEWEQKCVGSAANAAQFSLKMAQVFWYKKVES